MTIGIMQPYFLPYIGYFQLISACDRFVVYDNIKYTKKGWINRNRMLVNGEASGFSLPLKSDSDFLDIVQREISPSFDPQKLLNQFREAYRKAPHFRETMPLLERIIGEPNRNLFEFIFHSIRVVCGHLDIKTPLEISSHIPADHSLKSQERVIGICTVLKADAYVNAIGGTELYSKEDFRRQDIDLKFIKARPLEYTQLGDPFVPWLSIVDVLMFNSPEKIRGEILPAFDLVENS